MADVTRRFFLRHLRGAPTSWTCATAPRQGRSTRAPALSFWFRPLTAVLCEVPVDDRELPLLFHARTERLPRRHRAGHGDLPGRRPGAAATRLDFSIDPVQGLWRGHPLDQVAGLLAELAQQPALDLLARLPLAEALTTGIAPVRAADRATASPPTHGSPRPASASSSARVVAVRAEPDVERALQTPTREQVQQDADRATYERRAHGRRAGARDRRERAAEPDRARPPRAAARRAAWRQNEPQPSDASPGRRRRASRRSRPRPTPSDYRRGEVAAGHRPSGRAGRGRGGSRTPGGVPRPAAGHVLALALKELAGHLPAIGEPDHHPDLLTSGHPARRARSEEVTRYPQPAGRGDPSPHRAGRPARPARHARAGRVLPARPRPRPGRGGRPPTSAQAAPCGRCRRAIPADWRRGQVDRADLPRFLFAPRGRGDRRRPGRPGRQRRQVPRRPARHRRRPGARPQPRRPGPAPGRRGSQPACCAGPAAAARSEPAMVVARFDDGQRSDGLNEIFVGHPGHQSARYCSTDRRGRPRTAVVVRRARRHGHRRDRLVRVDRPGTGRRPGVAGPGRAGPVLVRPGGLALPRHRHLARRGRVDRGQPGADHGESDAWSSSPTASSPTPCSSPGARRSPSWSRDPLAPAALSAATSVDERLTERCRALGRGEGLFGVPARLAPARRSAQRDVHVVAVPQRHRAGLAAAAAGVEVVDRLEAVPRREIRSFQMTYMMPIRRASASVLPISSSANAFAMKPWPSPGRLGSSRPGSSRRRDRPCAPRSRRCGSRAASRRRRHRGPRATGRGRACRACPCGRRSSAAGTSRSRPPGRRTWPAWARTARHASSAPISGIHQVPCARGRG